MDVFVGARVIAGRYPLPASSRLYHLQGGRVSVDNSNTAAIASAGSVSGAVWSDLDGDGSPELILACDWGPIRVFKNDHGRLSSWDAPVTLPSVKNSPATSSSFSHLLGWWNGITT